MGNLHSCHRRLQEAFSFLMFGLSVMERRTKSQIKRSKRHWSHMPEFDSAQEELAKASNMEVFEELQRHPKWGSFFYTFAEGELVIGKKFAKGAQGKLYEAQVKWRHPNWRELFLREDVQKYPDVEYVLKVFKKGTLLEGMKSQWPKGMLQFHAEKVDAWRTRRYACDVVCGTLLNNGRFAFVLQREHADLRSLIERIMTWRPWTILKRFQHPGPFPMEVAEKMMYEVALGMNWLHTHGICHRDLKASNVLVREENGEYYCFVADYECSVGVFGTGFFRAPEILQACKDRSLHQNPGLFSKEADVYSYGMTCYEILTGKLPFEGHYTYEYHLVLEGPPLEVPKYVDDWMRELLRQCWQFNPKARPSFEEILSLFSAKSVAVQGSSSMHKFVARSQVHWSHPKTEFFTKSELIRHYRAMVYHTALGSETLATEIDPATVKTYPATTSDSAFFSAHSENTENGDSCTTTSTGEVLTESSKMHWSTVEFDDEVEEVEEVDNLEVFKALQMHSKWGDFFKTFGEGADAIGEMVIGQKFAEGGQADLFEVQVKWHDPEYRDEVLEGGLGYVLKVFKQGTSLRHLQSQWPQGMLQRSAERRQLMKTGIIPDWTTLRYTSDAVCGTLLKDGRFAFLFSREQEDLRSLIDRCMRTTPKDCGPFSKEVAERMMHDIALGMDFLHSHGILHRDLKAANVLIRRKYGYYQCLVADFEFSIGVIGTGFFRAPEILHAVKNRNLTQRPNLFTEKADVYSYGMTCYEILTGKVPFEGHDVRDYDLVITGQRPEVPQYVDDWAHLLLNKCWQSDPSARPSFGDILNLFSANVAPVDEDWQETTEYFID